MFHVKWSQSNVASTNSTKSSSDAFLYPKFFYLDQFLVVNLPLANQKRAQEMQIQDEIEALTKEREFITHYNVCSHLVHALDIVDFLIAQGYS
jgi:hypothetical protein